MRTRSNSATLRCSRFALHMPACSCVGFQRLPCNTTGSALARNGFGPEWLWPGMALARNGFGPEWLEQIRLGWLFGALDQPHRHRGFYQYLRRSLRNSSQHHRPIPIGIAPDLYDFSVLLDSSEDPLKGRGVSRGSSGRRKVRPGRGPACRLWVITGP
jgi:hypothetical protein